MLKQMDLTAVWGIGGRLSKKLATPT
ncbi:hypothetical protein [Alteromonas sp. LOR]